MDKAKPYAKRTYKFPILALKQKYKLRGLEQIYLLDICSKTYEQSANNQLLYHWVVDEQWEIRYWFKFPFSTHDQYKLDFP